MNTFILFGLLVLSSCAVEAQATSYDDYPDGKPRNSYERQQEEYRQHGYDTSRNGPLQETIEQQRREQRRQEEQARQDAQERQRRDTYHRDTCRGLYGC